ncbi:MAG: hypothetical protein QOF85_1629 [Solirubrobacterales bacterium]|nr:hypothetical protein [Solirubrobacterales bacterium]
MTELFLVPAADATARRNFARTVSTSVPLSRLRGLSASSLALAEGVPTGVAAWGTKAGRKVGTWEAMEQGDWVLFYSEGLFPVAGRVLLRERSRTVSKRLWGLDAGGATWEYMYLLDELRWIDAPRIEVLSALTYEPGYYPRGFTRVDKPIAYASVEEMLGELGAVGGALNAALDAAAGADDAAVAVAVDAIAGEMSRKALEEAIARRTTSAPPRVRTALARLIVRNHRIVVNLKRLYEGRCQCCKFTFTQANGKTYSEVAHLRAIAGREANLDVKDNLVVLCPNHHKMLDYGAIEIEYDPAADELLLHEAGATTEMVNEHIGPGRPKR